MRLDLASGKSEPLIPATLLSQSGGPSHPQASPDGKYLYYLQSRATGVGARLMRFDLAQGRAQQLATVHQFFALSPDGAELAAPVVDEAKNTTYLRVLGANGETRRDLITLPNPDRLSSVEWSPDGRQVFYSRTVSHGRMGLFRMPAAGGTPVALGVKGSNFPDIRIHPNGKEIAFVDLDSQMEVWKLEGLLPALARLFRTPGTQASQAQTDRVQR